MQQEIDGGIMPLFICDICSNIENTATGMSLERNRYKWKNPALNGKALCWYCIPTELEDGTPFDKSVAKGCEPDPKEIATEAMVRERGLYGERPQVSGVPPGFDYLGPFEYLRPELEKRLRLAIRRIKDRRRRELRKKNN